MTGVSTPSLSILRDALQLQPNGDIEVDQQTYDNVLAANTLAPEIEHALQVLRNMIGSDAVTMDAAVVALTEQIGNEINNVVRDPSHRNSAKTASQLVSVALRRVRNAVVLRSATSHRSYKMYDGPSHSVAHVLGVEDATPPSIAQLRHAWVSHHRRDRESTVEENMLGTSFVSRRPDVQLNPSGPLQSASQRARALADRLKTVDEMSW